MTRPFVSVLIDTYNHERFIERALQSVLAQDFPAADREILVVDDGSTDRTPDLVAKFAPHVHLLRKTNGGQASAFNVCISECRGEIIAFLDGDDAWTPDKLRRVLAVFSANPQCGIVGHGIRNCFEDGSEIIDAPEKPERLRLGSLAVARVFRLRKSYLGTSRMTIRAGIARQILPVPEALVIEADEFLFTLAAVLSDLVILPEQLTHYFVHGGNLYQAAGSNPEALRRKLRVHIALASALRRELLARGVPADAAECVTEIIAAEGDQIRLMLEGGAPWETLRTERAIYRIMHGDAAPSHSFFRALTMIPALILPPRWFYAGRRWLSSQRWYRRARESSLPPPRVNRVAGTQEFKA